MFAASRVARALASQALCAALATAACSGSQDSPPEGWAKAGPICDAMGATSSDASCYSGAGYCNPMLPSPAPENPSELCNCTRWQGYFNCVGSSGSAPLCSECDPGNAITPTCAPGLVCLPLGRCARICCTDGDCGGTPSSCTAVSGLAPLRACTALEAGSAR
ncbi:MAG: hypothetical protein HYZ29_24890 [Myxococcales bacterium]|nr:hypothetical protein [Myxococcales bacterium]